MYLYVLCGGGWLPVTGSLVPQIMRYSMSCPEKFNDYY